MAETIRGEDKRHPGNMCLTALSFLISEGLNIALLGDKEE